MRRKVRVETRRYATIIIDFDDEDEIDGIIKQAIQEDDPNLDWNETEIDCIETLCNYEEDLISDRAYEERRDADCA